MRQLPLLPAAAIGLGLIAFTAPAAAFTNSSPAGLRAGTPGLDAVEPVHCRRAVHKHQFGHRWSRGCGPGVVVIEGPRRHGVVVRDRARSGSSVTIRSGGGSAPSSGSSTTIRSGSGSAPAAGTSTTIKSGSGSTPAATTGAAPAPAAKQSAPEAKPSAPAATQSAPAAPQSAPAPKQ
jgi:hypothetical protein